MKNVKQYNVIRNLILGGAIFSILLMASCETTTYISPKEYLAKEQNYLNVFYNRVVDTVDNTLRTWLDTMTAVSVDTIDKRGESGMMLFHTKVGTGDSVKVFKSVGYRYTQYQILVDSLDRPDMYYSSSNQYSPSPFVYTTFLKTDASSSYATGVPQGVNEAILNMKYGGQCRVVVPSTLNSNVSYITTIFDIEITYLED